MTEQLVPSVSHSKRPASTIPRLSVGKLTTALQNPRTTGPLILRGPAASTQIW